MTSSTTMQRSCAKMLRLMERHFWTYVQVVEDNANEATASMTGTATSTRRRRRRRSSATEAGRAAESEVPASAPGSAPTRVAGMDPPSETLDEKLEKITAEEASQRQLCSQIPLSQAQERFDCREKARTEALQAKARAEADRTAVREGANPANKRSPEEEGFQVSCDEKTGLKEHRDCLVQEIKLKGAEHADYHENLLVKAVENNMAETDKQEALQRDCKVLDDRSFSICIYAKMYAGGQFNGSALQKEIKELLDAEKRLSEAQKAMNDAYLSRWTLERREKWRLRAGARSDFFTLLSSDVGSFFQAGLDTVGNYHLGHKTAASGADVTVAELWPAYAIWALVVGGILLLGLLCVATGSAKGMMAHAANDKTPREMVDDPFASRCDGYKAQNERTVDDLFASSCCDGSMIAQNEAVDKCKQVSTATDTHDAANEKTPLKNVDPNFVSPYAGYCGGGQNKAADKREQVSTSANAASVDNMGTSGTDGRHACIGATV
ncbi:unnamed protein product [Amoebophrya sp. A25]|nr:unnamed protein product [Amoebophrya sp. A25]|eukprot:GSA25T00020980001.1